MSTSLGTNKLTKQRNPRVIFSVLNNAKLQNKKIIVWRIIGDKKIIAEVKIDRIKKFSNELIVKSRFNQIDDFKKVTLGSDVLNVFLPADSILFQTSIKQFDDNFCILTDIPESITQIDRRKSLRLFIDETMVAKIKFYKKSAIYVALSKQLFEKTCYDLSSGGLSFIATNTEKKYFETKDEISEMVMLLGKSKIRLMSKIVNIVQIEPTEENKLHYRGWKIGLQFIRITKEVKELIDLFVFNNIDIKDT